MALSPFDDSDYFEQQTFTDSDLQGLEIADKEFHKCTFRNLKLGTTRWPGCKLETCVFEDCDLVRMIPSRMALRDVEFRGCRLMGVDFSDVSRNPELRFVDCNLRYASFVGTNLRKAAFTRCMLIESNFIEANLAEAVFVGSEFTGTTFRRCDLTKANMADARGLYVDPSQNKVKGLSIPLDAAIALAIAAGMKVAGFDSANDEEEDRVRRK